MSKDRTQVYAVLRYDRFLDEYGGPDKTVVVKEVVHERETAEREVDRLNALQEDDGQFYWWQTTRLYGPGDAAGSDTDED